MMFAGPQKLASLSKVPSEGVGSLRCVMCRPVCFGFMGFTKITNNHRVRLANQVEPRIEGEGLPKRVSLKLRPRNPRPIRDCVG